MRTNSKNNQKHLDKKWKVLTEAKKHLANNAREEINHKKTEFVCTAVGDVICFEYLKDSIKQDITNLLGGESTYNSWLIKELASTGREDEYQQDALYGYPKRQATRHAWVDWMIKEYKAKDE